MSLVAEMLDTRCDFCGQPFLAAAFNQRTCIRCEPEGAPDQSKLAWGPYQKALATYLRGIGRRAPLSGAAAQAKSGVQHGKLARRDKNGRLVASRATKPDPEAM